jgi:hypothetical protein
MVNGQWSMNGEADIWDVSQNKKHPPLAGVFLFIAPSHL